MAILHIFIGKPRETRPCNMKKEKEEKEILFFPCCNFACT